MRTLIIVRYGNCGPDGNLSKIGQRQVLSLITIIKEAIGENDSILILSSTTIGALQSAQMLSNALDAKLNIEPQETLCVDDKHVLNNDIVYELIKKNEQKTDVLILVTHAEYCKEIPYFFGEKRWSGFWQKYNRDREAWKINEGEAWFIDCVFGMITRRSRRPVIPFRPTPRDEWVEY